MPKPMKYDKKFAFLLSKEELEDIDELAEKLERSKSDAVMTAQLERYVLRSRRDSNPHDR